MMTSYCSPEFNKSAFHCPICNVYAEQQWKDLYLGFSENLQHYDGSTCSHCRETSIWFRGSLVYPDVSQAPMPNQDMPDDIKQDYNEARTIINRSPRAAAAMFRLCLQKLLIHLGGVGKINKDIKDLVAKGEIPERIAKSLDIIRVFGNESVHPGEINLNDEPSIANRLAKLINIIAESTVTQTKEIDALYEMIPVNQRDAIEKRDSGSEPQK